MSAASSPAPILYIHHRRELGGSPQSLFYLIRSLDRTRFEPHVYCPPGPAAELFAESGAIVHTGHVAGFTHIWASTYRGRRWLLLIRELWNLPLHILDLRRVLHERRFSLVHLNDSPLLAAAVMARSARIPVVWHLRSALPDEGLRSRAVRYVINHYSSATIAISQDVAESFRVEGSIVPNSVDLERFRPDSPKNARERLGLPVDRPIVSFFGYIYPGKGFGDFIRAAAAVRSSGIDAAFLIVGGDVRGEVFFKSLYGRSLSTLGLTRNYDAEARALVRELGLEDVVRFVPFTRETVSLYQASDIIVAPSRGPELGRPVIEAAACGRVVVASGSLGGAGLIIPNETGYLVPRRSPHMIAFALEWLLRDDAVRERMAASARRHAETTFSAEAGARLVTEVYERSLSSR